MRKMRCLHYLLLNLCLTNDRLICTIEREENCIASLDQDHFIALALIHSQFKHACRTTIEMSKRSVDVVVHVFDGVSVCACICGKEMERANSCAHLLV